MNSGRKEVTTPAKLHKAKGRRTKIHPAVQNPVENQAAVPNDAKEQTVVPIEKEQKQTDIHVKIEMDEMMTCDKEIQTEAPLSGVIRVLNSKQRNRKVQVKLPASTVVWRRDPKTVTLRKGLKQAKQEAEKLKSKWSLAKSMKSYSRSLGTSINPKARLLKVGRRNKRKSQR